MIRKRTRKNKDAKTVTSYQAIVRVKGYPDQVKTFRTHREADEWETKIKASMHAGTFRDDKDVRDKTLADAVDQYLEDPIFKKKKDKKTISGHLRYWKRELGKYALSKLTPDVIAKKRDELASGITVRHKVRTPATVNRYRASLSGVFKVAMEEWRWLDDSPMRFVRKLEEPPGRTRFLDDNELLRLLEVAQDSKSKYLYIVIVIALFTGMRRGEILKLKWSDVDLDTGRVVIRETKNGDTRVSYLTNHALDILQQHAQKMMFQSEYIFPNRWGTKPVDITYSWQKTKEQTGLEDFRFHDLRHTAASNLAMNGASPSEIADVLGHKSLSMVKRYAHIAEHHTKFVIESMNEKIFKSNCC